MTERAHEGTTHYQGCWKVHHECALEYIKDLTAERDALKQENDHLCDARNLGKCLEDMQPKNFATATEDELKEAMEYYETCRCHICQWTRYELERRQALARLSKP